MTTNPTDAERDADDAAYCAAYVDAVHLAPSSAIEYLRAMVAEYDEQARRSAVRTNTDGLARIAWAAAEAKRDAYDDALRVLDIAADSAQHIADRARADRRYAERVAAMIAEEQGR